MLYVRCWIPAVVMMLSAKSTSSAVTSECLSMASSVFITSGTAFDYAYNVFIGSLQNACATDMSICTRNETFRNDGSFMTHVTFQSEGISATDWFQAFNETCAVDGIMCTLFTKSVIVEADKEDTVVVQEDSPFCIPATCSEDEYRDILYGPVLTDNDCDGTTVPCNSFRAAIHCPTSPVQENREVNSHAMIASWTRSALVLLFSANAAISLIF